MPEERYTFSQTRARLEEIVVSVRKKDCSLEKSLDLLEEGVRLANICTEQSDRIEWQVVVSSDVDRAEIPAGEPAQAKGLDEDADERLGS